ncbi:AraC family transcriptional regulator [Maribacter sp.]|uniref:AraC family transcriptional regulator n=1 Tax=Maribacter sp. TaxID=1897614 RepID=UPI0025B9724F|nr:AraC family transcriptional regulator [Maribacter sp.]
MKNFSFLFLLFLSLCTSIKAQDFSNKTEIASTAQKRALFYLKKLQENYSNAEYELHKTYSDSLELVAKEHGLTKMHILSLTNQAIYFNNRAEQQKSILLYHTALEKCKIIPEDFKTRTVVLVNLGNTYYDIELYDKGIEIMEDVLEVANNAKNSTMIKAAALVGLSNNYSGLGELNKALDYAYRAKEIGEKNNNKGVIASAVNDICDILYQQKKYKKAIAVGNEALAYTDPEKPTKKRAWLLLNIGISYYKENNTSKALTYLKEANKIANSIKHLEIEMYCHEHLAQVYESLGDIKASHVEQKNYTKTRGIFLENTNKASQLDLKKEISDKEGEIVKGNETISLLLKNKKSLIVSGSIALLLLVGCLIFYIHLKKKEEKNKLLLQAQYTTLKKEIHNQNNTQTKSSSINKKEVIPYQNSSLSKEDRLRYKNSLLEYMQDKKPHLNASINQSELAKKLNLSSHHLSEVLHYELEQNFYNFINSYRVIEAQNLLKNPKTMDSKMIAIAFDSGFKSKTSFNRVFKNYTGLTPSEYREKQNS